MISRKKIIPAAFSLVELLVVIAIISVLVALLLPALSNSRAMGRKVGCMSNLRQIGIAEQAYANDNGDRFAACYFDPGNTLRVWQARLYDYTGINVTGAGVNFGNYGVFICPELRLQTGWQPTGAWRGYFYNHYICPNQKQWDYRRFVVPTPSKYILIGDGQARPDISPSGTETMAEIASWNPSQANASGSSIPDKRHLNGANFLFCDGHVEYFKEDQTTLNKEDNLWRWW